MRPYLTLTHSIGLLAALSLPQVGPGGAPEALEARWGPLVGLELPSPAPLGARWPSLAEGADGQLYLTFVSSEADGGGGDELGPRWTLGVARLEAGAWRPLADAASGRDWFVNWADFPSLAALADGTLATHILTKTEEGTYDYEVRTVLSRDAGASWSEPVRLHDDARPAEHGFVSLVPLGAHFVAVWLDGRETKAGGAMRLMARTLAPDGSLGPELVLDARVCDCCQTAAVAGGRGVAVAWRDRDPDEVRDLTWMLLGAAGLEAGNEPAVGFEARARPVARDGWKIAGCPVNGPALDAVGDSLAIAWFTTGPDDHPRVQYRRLGRGDRGGPVVVISDLDPLGRVDLVETEDGAWVSWLERRGDAAEWTLARIDAAGVVRERTPLARVASTGRDTGFGRLARHGGELYFTWTDPGRGERPEPSVRVLRLP